MKRLFFVIPLFLLISGCASEKTLHYRAENALGRTEKINQQQNYQNSRELNAGQFRPIEPQRGTQAALQQESSGNFHLMSETSDQIQIVKTAVKKRPNAIGVIIGNQGYARYRNGIPDVSYARRDAQAIRDMFIYRLGIDKDNIIYVEDATQATLFSIFGTKKNYKGKLYNWVKPNESEVFVYYSGHGAPSVSGKSAYLVPVDASTSYLAETGYELNTLYTNIAKLASVDNVVIIDSCFSGDSPGGMLFKNVSPALLKEVSHVERIKRSSVISSTSVGELSNWYPAKGHSLFTYYLLEAMNGTADINHDHKITMNEIKKYVDGEVPYKARRLSGREQHPVFIVDGSNRVLVTPAK